MIDISDPGRLQHSPSRIIFTHGSREEKSVSDTNQFFCHLAGVKMKSTHPALKAFKGMPLKSVVRCWEKMSPPLFLISLHPSVPSPLPPEKIIPIARFLTYSSKSSGNYGVFTP
jgi:hypothetical protein